ncbi:MAG TPA: GNAT family N-acetyltransferase [Gaiellaceae bacterium]
MAAPLLDHPRQLTESVARVLDGRAVEHEHLTGFVNSRFDAFLNQLFASGSVAPREAAAALEGRPGFVWLIEEPAPLVMYGMTAATGAPLVAPVDAEIRQVRSHADIDAWHEIYCEVLGADARGRGDWHAVHEALGPGGEGSLVLYVAHVDGSPAATGGVYFDQGWAGLYCFATRERMRGRGLASALVHASHEAARARGIERALLQATPMGRPVYAAAGYREERPLPLLRSR